MKKSELKEIAYGFYTDSDDWESRKENPRCCPRCKRHIKYDKPSCKVGESKKK